MQRNSEGQQKHRKKVCCLPRSNACREIRDNEYLFTEDSPSILDRRFESCLKWYIKNACFYKIVFYLATFLSAFCPIISVGLNNLFFENSNGMYIQKAIYLLSITAGISATVLSMSRAQVKWTRYRTAAEFLKRQRVQYLCEKENRNGSYDLDLKYLKIIEDFMANENEQWRIENVENSYSEKKKETKQD